ncbi:MAG TPA: hypothetical protein VK034_00125, partial [Enhygromyxa sp.]|nr:hypothetical protein [Enhygromyxa sp.]
YKPMAIKIAVEPVVEGWPQLAFVRGLPVLGLRALIWAYKRRTGHIEETFTHRALRTSIEAMVDILTRFENPGPGKPWTPTVEVEVDDGPPDNDDNVPEVGPNDVVPPLVVKEVANLEFIPQPKGNWCWAATSLMMRKFYLKDRSTIEDVVREMFPKLDDAQNSLRLSRLAPEGSVEGRLLSWETIKGHIDGRRPFILARQHHYLVCYGYEEGGPRAVKKLLYWDPLPQGAGRKTKMSYAEYQSFIQGGGGTAQAFVIKPQRVLLPLEMHRDSYNRDANTAVFTADATGLMVASCEVLIRIARNSLGEPGEVVVRQQHAGMPGRFEWDLIVPLKHWDVGQRRMEVLMQVEATLRAGPDRAPPGGTKALKVSVERPSG